MKDETVPGSQLTMLDVGLAYRLFLMRAPENKHVLQEKISLDIHELALLFIQSDEFRQRIVEMADNPAWEQGRATASSRLVEWTARLSGKSLTTDMSRAALLLAMLETPMLMERLESSPLAWSLTNFCKQLGSFARSSQRGPEFEYLSESKSNVQAGFDFIKDGILEGWLIGADQRQGMVGITVDDTELAKVSLNRRRSDIPHSRNEAAARGFALPLPQDLFDGDQHRITLSLDGLALIATTVTLAIEDGDGAIENSAYALDMSGLFDADHYAEQLGYLPQDPLHHYRTEGWRKGLDPHPLFLTEYYVGQRPQAIRFDPLYDFFTLGQFEPVPTHPLLPFETYALCRPDALERRLHPTLHYINEAWLDPNLDLGLFDSGHYLASQPNLISDGWRPLIHYLRFGFREGRHPHREFDPHLFARLANLPDDVEPLTHFAQAIADMSQACATNHSPEVSVIVLNLNKWLMTVQCLYFLKRHTRGINLQIIVIDNGSSPEVFRSLCDKACGAQIIRSDRNLGFGEANNFATEFASAPLLMLLNNDAFVGENWLTPLREKLLSSPEIAAVGPKLRFADGRLQEAGGSVSADGGVIQFGKGLDAGDEMFNYPRKVDYISAAALLMRLESFQAVLGFDLCWDPAYYEDVDLCLKLAVNGGEIWYISESEVTHLESATSSDDRLRLGLHNIVAINRLKFVRRWGSYLSGRSDGQEKELLPPLSSLKAKKPTKRIALFTPYPLTPGGGERYLLSIADLLRDKASFTLFALSPTSRMRMRTLGRELGLNLDDLAVAVWNRSGGERNFDIFISMGNEALPMAPGIGNRNFYICQFPFPMLAGHYARDWGLDQGYNGVLVYSEYTKRAYEAAMRRLGSNPLPTYIVSPPAPPVVGDHRRDGIVKILNVGRFHPGGHCKRQDVMIDAFAALLHQIDRPVELHFAGALGSDGVAREYFLSLQRQAQRLPIFFHVNPLPSQLAHLYLSSTIYWHCTGISDDERLRPERFEHFGITIVEAMSAGVIPVVLRHGGPGEIVRNGVEGYLVENAVDLASKTKLALDASAETILSMSNASAQRARAFTPEQYRERLIDVLDLA